MARFDEQNEYEIKEMENAVAVKAQGTTTELTPENVETLSTGVKVQFYKMLPGSIGQKIVVNSFVGINVDSKGRIKADMTSSEQLSVAKKLFEFNAALILQGLATGAMDVYGGLPENEYWLDIMRLDPTVLAAHPHINFQNELHQKFLYLFYHGFESESDFEILSRKLINQ